MTTIRRHRHRNSRRRAFTLLEVIVVVTIIALLATMIVPKLLRNIGSTKQKLAQAEVSTLANQISLWMADNGHSRLPDDFDLEILTEGNDPYLDPDDLLDPWDNEYRLNIPGEVNHDFDVVSFGANGEPGGEDEDADVYNK